MTDRGKYHGQRLKAKDVLRLYAAGERDFRGAILRGCNFQEADLSEADFTGADAQSAKFVDAHLYHSNFSKVKCGRTTFLARLNDCMIFCLNLIFSGLYIVAGGITGIAFFWYQEPTVNLLGFSGITVFFAVLICLLKYGVTTKSIGLIAIATFISAIFATVPAVRGGTALAEAYGIYLYPEVFAGFIFGITFTFGVASSSIFTIAVLASRTNTLAVYASTLISGTYFFYSTQEIHGAGIGI